MKKKLLSMLLVGALVVTMLAGCGNKGTGTEDGAGQQESAEESEEEGDNAKGEVENQESESNENADAGESKHIVFCAMTLEGDYWQWMRDAFKEQFEAVGYTFESVSADMDAVRQIEQIENASVSGADGIVVIAVDATAVSDACQKAMDQGVRILAFIKDTVSRDTFRGTDETIVGAAIVELSQKWVKEKFGDEQANILVVGAAGAGGEKARFDSVLAEAEKVEQFHILEAQQVENSQAGAQSYAETIFQKYPETNLVIVCAGEMGLGVSSYLKSEGSVIKDFDKIGIITTEITPEIADAIKAAENNEGVIRGTVSNGGVLQENVKAMVEQMQKMLNGEAFEEVFPVDVSQITFDNLSDFGY